MPSIDSVTIAYRYAVRSEFRHDSARSELTLATSGGATETGPALCPYFFTGFLTEPTQAAAALLACSAIARARYFDASALARYWATDPVVTSNGDRLRFESFSACCGVHARLDLPPAALDNAPVASGTTNVDFNPEMRAALSGAVAASGPLLLRVGSEAVTVTTETTSVTERKVSLPARWVKGFGEVQALAQQMQMVAEVDGTEARRFVSALPRAARSPLWAVQAGRSLGLVITPRPGAACVAGPERFGEFRPLLRFARALRVYSPPVESGSPPAPSAWELDLGAARFTLTLSPQLHRGFTGEGALLGALAAADTAAADAELIGALLAWEPVIDVARLAADCGIPAERGVACLAHLATSGRVGYDLSAGVFFHRELPFTDSPETAHPRLADARSLVCSGMVTPIDGGAVVGDAEGGHRVTFASPHDMCTCPWWGKHQGTRGPCKHVLAARIAGRQPEAALIVGTRADGAC